MNPCNVQRLCGTARWLPFALAGTVFFLAACIGTWRNYSPVPYWDMWNGYLDFFFHAGEGWEPWWALHNEHRLVLARALFWLDLSLFRGSLVLLFALNVVLATALYLTFARLLTLLLPHWRRDASAMAALGLLAVLGFSWLQQANFTWAFQSQFFLSYLLPFWAFALLAAASRSGRRRYFALASLCGIASVGTMANGLLALPLMVVMAGALRLGWRKVLFLALLAAITTAGYLTDYTTPPGHSSLPQVLREQPLLMARYLLTYLGSPWFFITGRYSLWLATAAGALLIAASAWLCLRLLCRRDPNPWHAALIFLLLYIGGTAVGTSGGRALMGLDQALTSRYMTPVLMAWSALLLLFISRRPVPPGRPVMAGTALLALMAIPLLLWPNQRQALERPNTPFTHKVAALAVELGVLDDDYLRQIYFNRERLLRIAEQPRALNLSVFGYPTIRDARLQLGQHIAIPGNSSGNSSADGKCRGYLDSRTPLDNEPGFVRIAGWLHETARDISPRVVRVVTADGEIVGYALGGPRRPDVASALGEEGATHAGFVGYLRSEFATAGGLALLGQQPACRVGVPPR